MIGGHHYDPLKSDIWSVGIIFFALVCGYLPFDDPDTTILYNKIMRGKYETPSHVSAEVVSILKGMLNTNPIDRLNIENIRNSDFFKKYNNDTIPCDEKPKINNDICNIVAKALGKDQITVN